MPTPIPSQTPPPLLAILDSVALFMSDDVRRAWVSPDAITNPMRQWWEIGSWLPEASPPQWQVWIKQMQRGSLPDKDTCPPQALAMALSCYPCQRTREQHTLLVLGASSASLTPVTPLSTDDALFPLCHATMLSLLDARDRAYFAPVESMDLPWHIHWAAHRGSTLRPSPDTTPLPLSLDDTLANLVNNA